MSRAPNRTNSWISKKVINFHIELCINETQDRQSNVEARSLIHCCRGEGKCVKYYVCVILP